MEVGQKCSECCNKSEKENSFHADFFSAEKYLVELIKDLYAKNHIYHSTGCNKNSCTCDVHKITASLLKLIPDLPVVKKEKVVV